MYSGPNLRKSSGSVVSFANLYSCLTIVVFIYSSLKLFMLFIY